MKTRSKWQQDHQDDIFSSIIDLCWNWKNKKEFIKVFDWIVKHKYQGILSYAVALRNILPLTVSSNARNNRARYQCKFVRLE